MNPKMPLWLILNWVFELGQFSSRTLTVITFTLKWEDENLTKWILRGLVYLLCQELRMPTLIGVIPTIIWRGEESLIRNIITTHPEHLWTNGYLSLVIFVDHQGKHIYWFRILRHQLQKMKYAVHFGTIFSDVIFHIFVCAILNMIIFAICNHIFVCAIFRCGSISRTLPWDSVTKWCFFQFNHKTFETSKKH